MPQIPKDEWVPRFAKKLREQLPEVSGDEATSVVLAEAMFAEAADMSPEQAVETIASRSRLIRLERYRKTVTREL